jgi:peptidoglycan/LPS O-acetylase OafA/YrhL
MHPVWGLGFFILVNRVVQAEQLWLVAKVVKPGVVARITIRVVAAAAFVGVFSYSLYLTHELVIMQSWSFVIREFPPILNSLLIVVPATLAFAWVFYRFCEKPYMRKAGGTRQFPDEQLRIEEQRIEEAPGVFVPPSLLDEA